jgi:hypothetical protein
MNTDNTQTKQNGTLWLVAIVSILALILGWAAFNRSGDNLTTEIQQGANELSAETTENYNQAAAEIESAADSVVMSVNDIQARAEVRAELLAIEARIAAEEGYEAAADEVKNIRTNFMAAYENVEDEAKQNWQQLDLELNQLEESLRTNSANALETLADFIASLGADVRVDGANE